MKLKGLTAIVTGATSGIGKEIAYLFSKEGAKVAVIGRDNYRGAKVVETIEAAGGTAAFFNTDLTDPNAVAVMFSNISKEFDDIDIVVNCAGVVIPGTVDEISYENWENSWLTNVTSVFLVCNAVIPSMIRRSRGNILNIASEAGLKGLEKRAAYCAAKSAIIGLTKAMSVDYSKNGIMINCLCPGTIETEMVEKLIMTSNNPKITKQAMINRRSTPYLGTAEEVSRAALFLVDPLNKYITGTILAVDGGATAR
ncbi:MULTISPECIES: SDR family NAD(P)-dependent oxidoreductase [Paenibacillus]|uniref:Short-chain dehydrogenase n=1 Tax=Paenibacillus borealis TaxID=160799 RepID=A0ABX3GWI7_PAEBO|nr:SDR family oxidoreductase [Paenibacillus borealis]OMD36388.1 hypothetical protein BSK56_32215 [Paenibacillus borealis]